MFHVKQITLSIKEWILFKEIAQFFYEVAINKGQVIVKADSHMLEDLGY